MTISFADWPQGDRQLWEAGVATASRLSRRRYAAGLRPRSILKFQEGYGRWLGFLAGQGCLNSEMPPQDRVTFVAVGEYFCALQLLGNQPATLYSRIAELRYALKIMAPHVDFGWLLSPDGVSLEAMLPKRRKPKVIIHPRTMFTWGIEMMGNASQLPGIRSSTAFRDGLAIAILSIRAPRLRSMISMEIDENVIQEQDDVLISFRDIDMKTGCPLQYPLPRILVPYVTRYLRVERPTLLRGSACDAFWVSRDRGALSPRGMQTRILRLTEKKFGKRVGIHNFRHCIGTIGPALFPERPAVAAAILGISPKMVEDHYNRAGYAAASAGLNDAIQEVRRETSTLGYMLLRDGPKANDIGQRAK